ncbi:MAG: hypothetical protein KBA54_00805 [Candidatus Cloacimonetes bacterium]|nr:hypothetical protein [Candidatus Cloacimonadota bacterium]
MVFRGKKLRGVRQFHALLILAIGMMGAVSGLSAQNALPQMAEYTSTLNYKLKYPRSWLSIDRSNTGAVREEHNPAGADSNAVHSSHLNFLITQIDSLEIKAAFVENPSSDDSAAILVSFGPRIEKVDKGTQNILTDSFNNLLIPPGAVVNKLDFGTHMTGLKRNLFLSAKTSGPGNAEGRYYHSVAVNGNDRSFILTLLGSEADVQRQMPVLESMAASIKDSYGTSAGNDSMAPGFLILLIILISMVIAWLIIRLRNQGLVRSRGSRRRKGIAFFPLFLIILVILFVLVYLLTPGRLGFL